MITLQYPAVLKQCPWDHEIYKFSRGLPGQHNYEFGFSFRLYVKQRRFLKNGQIFNLPLDPAPWAVQSKHYNMCNGVVCRKNSIIFVHRLLGWIHILPPVIL